MEIAVFLLTADWEDRDDIHILKFYGWSEKGPVEIIIEGEKPSFFIARKESDEESDKVETILKNRGERKEVQFKNMEGRAVDLIQVKTQRDLWTVLDQLGKEGIKTYESDVRTPERFMMERFIHAQRIVEGEVLEKKGLLSFVGPKVRAGDVQPFFTVASLDIETGMGDNRLFSIALDLRDGKKQRMGSTLNLNPRQRRIGQQPNG